MDTALQTGALNLSRRLRRTPFTAKVEEHGVRGFSVVNHMLLPKAFQSSVDDDYWHLRAHVQIWDVACQRQVEIRGADAARLVQWMTPRDLRRAKIGDCLYVPLVDAAGGMVNDPVLLKLAEDRFWLSIADSDVLLWADGLASGAGLDVTVTEPDVSPLAVQGARAEALMAAVFGDGIRRLRFFQFAPFDFMGSRQIIARSGYSSQDGFEIYLQDARLGGALWERLWDAGQAFNLRPGCPNLIDRIEAGLLSYGNDITRDTNPLECGLGAFCDTDNPPDCLAADALRAIKAAGIRRQIRGVLFHGAPCPVCAMPWSVLPAHGGATIGEVTSAIYSPRLRANVGLAMMAREFWDVGQAVRVKCSDGETRDGVVVALPFA